MSWARAACLAAGAGALAAASAPSDARVAAVTVRDASANAFGYPLPALTRDERRAFAVGNSFFRQNWVEAPSSTSSRDGLGPLFNARSCSGCHAKDGRSRPPEDGERGGGLLVRIGVRAENGADRPHPLYGDQVQDDAVLGAEPEARVVIRRRAIPGAYEDGTRYELEAPRYELADAAYGPVGDGAVLGGRTAPHLVGLGLLEAIPEAALIARADPDDRDGDGISGRVHFVGEPRRLGRFGWKATQPDVRAQTAAAFLNDMGITSSALPREPFGATQDLATFHAAGETAEIADDAFEHVVFYTRALAVPARRDADRADVLRGAALFAESGCAACHVPEWTTGSSSFHRAYAGRSIAPYTDLLLHDLGPDLADEKRDGDAAPSEWRTPPLWGIGLVPAVNGHTRFLHDGRARDFAEAILWHGGEADAARERFRRASAADRAALLAFLGSL